MLYYCSDKTFKFSSPDGEYSRIATYEEGIEYMREKIPEPILSTILKEISDNPNVERFVIT